MRVVVTGATGNVGTALLRALADEPAVTAITGIARRRPAWSVPKTTWARADVARDDLEPHLHGADAVVHLAWLIQPSRNERATRAVNVEGSARVFAATARAGVGALVHASSVGVYAPGPKDRQVDESWPATGIPSSFYSRHKAAAERALDGLEIAHPDLRVVRLRPGLVFQRPAASEIRRLFAGPFVPRLLLRRGVVPVVPRHPRLRVQAVHADDLADAYRRVLLGDVRGAFNVAADPVLDGEALRRALGARATVPVAASVLRAAASLTWRARLQPTEPGWLDLGLGVPLMDVGRVRSELGWTPVRTATAALDELLDGLRRGEGGPTPPLDRDAGGPGRAGELATGVGGRA
jgi:UDP-glucose 4-epimerase